MLLNVFSFAWNCCPTNLGSLLFKENEQTNRNATLPSAGRQKVVICCGCGGYSYCRNGRDKVWEVGSCWSQVEMWKHPTFGILDKRVRLWKEELTFWNTWNLEIAKLLSTPIVRVQCFGAAALTGVIGHRAHGFPLMFYSCWLKKNLKQISQNVFIYNPISFFLALCYCCCSSVYACVCTLSLCEERWNTNKVLHFVWRTSSP